MSAVDFPSTSPSCLARSSQSTKLSSLRYTAASQQLSGIKMQTRGWACGLGREGESGMNGEMSLNILN